MKLYFFIKKIIKKIILVCFSVLLQILPIRKNQIFIINFHGSGFEGGQKNICLELLKQNKKIKIYWAVDNNNYDFPLGIIPVEYKSKKYKIIFSTSKIIINSIRNNIRLKKKKNQFYIQLWHSSFPFGKKVEKDAENVLSEKYITAAKQDGRDTDLMISGCRTFTNLIYKSFYYFGPIFEIGYPQYDPLFGKIDENVISKVYKRYNINKNAKIVIYLPTFRKKYLENTYDIDLPKVKESLEKKFTSKFVVFVHFHKNYKGNKFASLFDNINYFNVTDYPDSFELKASSFCSIGDYSAADLEMGVLHKPVFKYINDIEDYKKDRGFYYYPWELPFPCSRNMSELLYNIEQFNYEKYNKTLDIFYRKIKIIKTSNSSSIIADLLIDKIYLNKKKFDYKYKTKFIYKSQ